MALILLSQILPNCHMILPSLLYLHSFICNANVCLSVCLSVIVFHLILYISYHFSLLNVHHQMDDTACVHFILDL